MLDTSAMQNFSPRKGGAFVDIVERVTALFPNVSLIVYVKSQSDLVDICNG